MTVLVRFIIIGVSAALIFVGTAFSLRSWMAAPPYIASSAAFVTSFAYAYPMQRSWTFSGRHGHREALPRYFAAQVSCLVISALLSQALVVIWAAQPFAMAALTAVIVSAISFVLTRFWVFS